jgi:hypothetical protein
VVSYGNVAGHTYTQDNKNPDGFKNTYEVWLYYPTPTPSPIHTPTASPRATPKPSPTASGKGTPPPTPVPTVTPTPVYEKITTYVGTYSMPSFDITVDGSKYATNSAPGCAQIVLIEAPSGSAGQMRRRPDLDSYGGDNSMAFGDEKPPSNVEIEDVYDGVITAMTITNLTPSSGTAKITLDNGTVGTITITGSVTATVEESEVAQAQHPVDDHRNASSLLERYANPHAP